MYCGQRLRDDLAATRPLADEPGSETQTRTFLPAKPDPADASAAEGPRPPEPTPQTIGGYRLLRLLGAGGMGTVYEAEVPDSTHRVAVKLLSSRLAASPTSVERFKQEGRLASQLTHPRCVFVLAADTDAGRPYIVMELMPGATLKDLVEQRGPLPEIEAVTRILDVIDGLTEAHRLGMIHRDIKPSNCFLTADNRVKVGDFGLSKSLVGGRNHHLTQSGAFLGTVLFASPEQIRGEPLDYGSDVYSVCATLYYLLCGQAPFQHDNATVVLAKAISEDAPPIRQFCPTVSAELEAVLARGLERDRTRRWQSLDELRDALVALLPSRQLPARPRALIGAYVLDHIALGFLTVPLELLSLWVLGRTEDHVDIFEFSWFTILLLIAYFGIGEGVFGTTPGKWLIGLRVSRLGQTGPPGLLRAILRTVVFHSLVFGVIWLPELLIAWFGATAGGVLGGAAAILSGAGLLVQLRRRWGFRGLHDFVTGCHVTQRPLPARTIHLPTQHPTPLERLQPAAVALPESVGVYAVQGCLAGEPTGEQVWLGEDRSLARRVLIWLTPASTPPPPAPEVHRPTRLRRLGTGTLTWNDQSFHWMAFVAPLGGPLSETIHPARPLPWADARLILDQLVEELRTAEADGTLPPCLGLDQVWVEPNGRVQLLERSLTPPTPVPPRPQPLLLVREVASLALEGRPRRTPGPVHAPVPAHAVPLLDRLFSPTGYPTLSDLQHDLGETHQHRPEVTPALRAAQLGLLAVALALPLGLLFALTFALAPLLAYTAQTHADYAQAALAALADPDQRDKLAGRPELTEPLKHPRLTQRLDDLHARMLAEAETRRDLLLQPQRFLLTQLEEFGPDETARDAGYPVQVREAIIWAGAADGTPRAASRSPWQSDSGIVLLTLLGILLALVVQAALVRGSVSMLLTGIAIVQGNGQRATRRRCALRAALIWLPLVALLIGSASLQIWAPERVYLAAGLWLLAIALIPIFVVIALNNPTRPPQDRVCGTYLVPQ
jgi:hypothetical protein